MFRGILISNCSSHVLTLRLPILHQSIAIDHTKTLYLLIDSEQEHLHHCQERADLLDAGRHQPQHVGSAGKRWVRRSAGRWGERGEEED